jgi:2-dehydropantoate 2-reductase
MKILVYGAGVIGTLYAARLQEAGRQVTVLARGGRCRQPRAVVHTDTGHRAASRR